MAAVPRFGTGDSTTATAASGTGSALTIAKPSNVAVGDLLVGNFYSQFSGTVTSAPAGWTLIKTWGSRSGGVYYLPVPDSTTLSGLPSTWSMTVSGSGRLAWEVFRITGADLSSPIDVTGAEASQNSLASFALPSVTTTQANDLLLGFAYWNNSSTAQSTYTPDAAMTDGEQVKSPATGNTSGIDVAYQQLGAAGATGTRTFSMSPTGASNGGFMLAVKSLSTPSATAAFSATAGLSATTTQAYSISAPFGASAGASGAATVSYAVSAPFAASAVMSGSVTSGSNVPAPFSATASLSAAVTQSYSIVAGFGATAGLSASATPQYVVSAAFAASAGFSASASTLTPVQQWIATQPLYAAHRGGSADWPQSTMYAYDNAAAWNTTMALEVSMWQSADGVWVINHDNDPSVTGTWANPGTGNISARNWTGDLQNIVSSTGSYPIMRLETLLAKYGGKRVLIIDNKGSQDVAGLISILNANGGPGYYVSKSYYTAASWPNSMRSAGYKTLGYFYDADTSNIAANQSKFDVLMEDYTASTGSWTTILSYPQPVMAHIIPDAAAKATATSKGAEGYMVSGVMEAVPQTGYLATFGASASFGGAASQSYSVTAPFSAAAALSGVATPKYAIAPAFGVTAVASGGAVPKYSINAAFVANAVFTVSSSSSGIANAAFAATANLGGSVSVTVPVSAGFAASGAFSANVVISQDYEVFVWDGASLIPATLGVWDGASIISAEVLEIV